MRWHLLTLVALAGVTLAQTTNPQTAAPATPGLVIQGGYATTPVTAPTVITPRVTLGIGSANPVGATSSANGLQVGATSAAIPPVNAQGQVVNVPIVSNAGTPSPSTIPAGNGAAATIVAPGPNANAESGNGGVQIVTGASSMVESGTDVAAAARYYRTHPMHAVKVYTNDDVNRLEQQGSTGGLSNGTLPASDMNAPSAPASSNPAATMPQAEQPASPPAQAPAPPVEQPKSKPAPYTPPATPPQ
jgi:hypothetical protein